MAMTPEQIKAIESEIDTFGQKAIQYAASDPGLSAHYNRLYSASKMFLAKSAKMALSAKHREINEKRRTARKTGAAQSGTQRPSASSQKAP
jgi:hypothetical protein